MTDTDGHTIPLYLTACVWPSSAVPSPVESGRVDGQTNSVLFHLSVWPSNARVDGQTNSVLFDLSVRLPSAKMAGIRVVFTHKMAGRKVFSTLCL